MVHLHLQPRRQCDAEAEHTEHLEAVREREPSQARVHVVLGGNERGTGQPHHEGAQDTDADAEPLQRDLERQVRSVFGVHEFVRQRVDGGHALEGTQREDTLDALAKVLATHTHTHTHTHTGGSDGEAGAQGCITTADPPTYLVDGAAGDVLKPVQFQCGAAVVSLELVVQESKDGQDHGEEWEDDGDDDERDADEQPNGEVRVHDGAHLLVNAFQILGEPVQDPAHHKTRSRSHHPQHAHSRTHKATTPRHLPSRHGGVEVLQRRTQHVGQQVVVKRQCRPHDAVGKHPALDGGDDGVCDRPEEVAAHSVAHQYPAPSL